MYYMQNNLANLMRDSKQECNDAGRALYKTLIEEEKNELFAETPGTPEHFKELCDLLWVTIQLGNQCGYDLEAGMDALVEEYSSKFCDEFGNYAPKFREDGKLLKGAGFKKADFSELM